MSASDLKRWAVLLGSCAAVLVGCRYEVPLGEDAELPVERDLLGLWMTVPEEEGSTPARMNVLRYSTNEYLIHYPVGDGDLYFRAFTMEVAGRKALQVELIGTENGALDADAKQIFDVFTYDHDAGRLVVSQLNGEKVSDDIQSTSEMLEAFSKAAGDPDLFIEPETFVRIEAKR